MEQCSEDAIKHHNQCAQSYRNSTMICAQEVPCRAVLSDQLAYFWHALTSFWGASLLQLRVWDTWTWNCLMLEGKIKKIKLTVPNQSNSGEVWIQMQLELQLGKFAERKQRTPIDLDLSCRGRMHKACCAFVACRGGARCPGCDTAQSRSQLEPLLPALASLWERWKWFVPVQHGKNF